MDISYFDPEEGLVNLLRRAVTNAQDIVITSGNDTLSVFGTRGAFLARVGNIGPFCRLPASEFTVEVLKSSDPRCAIEGRDVNELMWKAAFYASGGRLLAGCYRDDVVELVTWPNLSRLPITPNTVRICAFLSRYPSSLWLVCRLLKIELEEACQFYSAARCAGFARAVNRKSGEPVLEPHRNQGVLSLLFRKLAEM